MAHPSPVTSLLGPQFSEEWPYTEASFTQALNLRVEQEKTKQEFYRLEAMNRTIEVLKMAMAAQIPGHMIPQLINQQQPPQQQSGPPPMMPQGPPILGPPVRVEPILPPMSGAPGLSPGRQNAGFKFPPETPRHRRTNSPARIGAPALSTHFEADESRSHRRNVSLPNLNGDKKRTMEQMSSVLNFGWQHVDPSRPKKKSS